MLSFQALLVGIVDQQSTWILDHTDCANKALDGGMTENRRTPQDTLNNHEKVLKTVKL